MKSNYDVLGNYIRLIDTRNKDNVTDKVMGINIDKFFMPSVANVIGTDLSKYKLITKGKFACNPMHVGRDERLPVALYEEVEPALVSPAYFMFEIIDNTVLDENYLMMWFRRAEFDRICWLHTDGSVRGGITWDDICRMELPVPDIRKQREIVNSYKVVSDRIELKQKINHNLAAEINTIYHRWFNEFLSPYASSEKYATEFGDLPIGWKIAELGNYIESFSKAHSFNKESLIFLNTSDILAGDFLCNTYNLVADMPGQAKKQIAQGDILFSEIRPANKRYALVTFPADDYVVSTKLMVLRTNQSELSNLRIYHYLTMDKTLDDLHREADGKSGTFPQITFDENLRHRKFVVADDETECQFNKLLKGYYELENTTRKELAALKSAASSLLCSLSH